MSNPNTEFTRDPQPDFERRPELRDERTHEWRLVGLDALAEHLEAQAANPFTADPPQEQNHG